MSSTHSLTRDGRIGAVANGIATLALAGCCAAIVVGCGPSKPQVDAQRSFTAEPIYPDPAMSQRDWPPSIASYPTGTVQAFATRWPLENQPQTAFQPLDAVLDPVVFIAQAIMLPVRVVQTPPGTMVNYVGEAVPPTYNAMPPLPPEPLPPRETPAPKPAPHHHVRAKPYRPFGALRSWWSGLFETEPKPQRRMSTSIHPSAPAETISQEPLTTEPTTTTSPTTEGAAPQTEPAAIVPQTQSTPAGTEPATTPAATVPATGGEGTAR